MGKKKVNHCYFFTFFCSEAAQLTFNGPRKIWETYKQISVADNDMEVGKIWKGLIRGLTTVAFPVKY